MVKVLTGKASICYVIAYNGTHTTRVEDAFFKALHINTYGAVLY